MSSPSPSTSPTSSSSSSERAGAEADSLPIAGSSSSSSSRRRRRRRRRRLPRGGTRWASRPPPPRWMRSTCPPLSAACARLARRRRRRRRPDRGPLPRPLTDLSRLSRGPRLPPPRRARAVRETASVPAEDDAAVEPVLEVQPVAALDVEGEVPGGLASHDGTLELEPAEVAVLDVQHGVLGVELGERADPALLEVRELPWEYRHVPGFLDARSLVDVLAVAPAEELGGHELPDGRRPDARELPAVHGGVEDLAASLGLTLFLHGERVSLLVPGGSLLRRHPR